MALNKSEGLSIVYLNVADGRLVRQYKEKNDKTIERVTTTGKTVYEEYFKDLTGYITSITTRDTDFGKQLQVVIKDGEENYIISMKFGSRNASSFLKALPNVDKDEEVRVMPWIMKDRLDITKKITGITIYQNNIKVPPAFTKDNPNGLPQMKQFKVKGKIQWDDTEMMDFLYNRALSWINNQEQEALPF